MILPVIHVHSLQSFWLAFYAFFFYFFKLLTLVILVSVSCYCKLCQGKFLCGPKFPLVPVSLGETHACIASLSSSKGTVT